MSTISKNHPNRALHNWLAYNISDHFLQKYSPLYKGTLYDLGAGTAPYRDFFLRHSERYVAVDWSESLHNVAVDILADLNAPLPIDRCAADTVVSLSVLEHLREPQLMLAEAFRILKFGGNLILQVPWQWRVHEAPHDYFRYTPYGLKYLLENVGFKNVTIEAQAGLFTTLTLKLNYFTARFVRGPFVLRAIMVSILVPLWYAGQKMAPMLDRLDNDWQLESAGYYVTAKKE